MSRHFNADEYKAPPARAPFVAATKAGLAVAVAYTAYSPEDGLILGVEQFNAPSLDNAAAQVENWLMRTYPICGGFVRHGVKALALAVEAQALHY